MGRKFIQGRRRSKKEAQREELTQFRRENGYSNSLSKKPRKRDTLKVRTLAQFEQTEPKTIIVENDSRLSRESAYSVNNGMSKGELLIYVFLKNNEIRFEREKIFPDCVNKFTLQPLRFDFYLPKYNTCIEFDGEQHFRKTSIFADSDKDYLLRISRDRMKNKYCKDNKITLIRISYKEMKNINHILKDRVLCSF